MVLLQAVKVWSQQRPRKGGTGHWASSGRTIQVLEGGWDAWAFWRCREQGGAMLLNHLDCRRRQKTHGNLRSLEAEEGGICGHVTVRTLFGSSRKGDGPLDYWDSNFHSCWNGIITHYNRMEPDTMQYYVVPLFCTNIIQCAFGH